MALKYTDKEMQAPRVIAKGADLVAMRIREIAKEHHIPTLEAPPLARALYKHTAVNQEIPLALYSAVAEVLAWAYQLRRLGATASNLPPPPRDLPVPAALDPLGHTA